MPQLDKFIVFNEIFYFFSAFIFFYFWIYKISARIYQIYQFRFLKFNYFIKYYFTIRNIEFLFINFYQFNYILTILGFYTIFFINFSKINSNVNIYMLDIQDLWYLFSW